ncbi:ORF6N domain-containing protein [Rhodophyticola sp. CCM32]|nr:ORF6N domain-containing protein [Rhodophyticola sp. CCM32]
MTELHVYVLRGVPVIMDEDLADRFGYTTGRLNEQVKRNIDRFGNDFAFQLNDEEWAGLKSQIAIANPQGRGGRRTPPWVYSEYGVVMAATILKSDQAVAASKLIVRTFVVARTSQLAAPDGRNHLVPVALDSVLPSTGAATGIRARAEAAIGKILDAIADPVSETTVRDEARSVALESLNAVKEHLKAQGIQNQKGLAEIQKLIHEADALEAEITARYIENDHRRLAYMAKQLRIVIEIERYLETGNAEGFLALLKDISGD